MGAQTGVDSALTQSTTKINVTTKVKNKQQAMDCKELATIYKDLFNERVLEDFNLRTILYDDLYKLADDNNLNQLKNYIKKIEKLF